MSESFALTARGLAAGYRGEPVVREIAFTLPRGKILALIGPNGAGKSTVLRTLARQLEILAGTVCVDGRELSSMPRAELARKMAVLFTERVRPELMTCFEVAAAGRYPYTGRFGVLTERDRGIVREALARVRAEDLADRPFDGISDGQRQRVLLARALCQQPEILVLDEPTSFLDIRHKIDLLDTLGEEARCRGLTCVLSLHEIDLAEKIADLVLCVRDGLVVRAGAPEEVFGDAAVAELYGLERGSWLTRRGSVELARPEGEPRIFVVGGGGFGIPHYRALQRRRVPFAAGVLFDNDVEHDVAKALAARTVSVPAFEPVPPEAAETARRLILSCGLALDAGTPAGTFNRVNAELLDFAARQGIRVVKSADETD